MRSPFFLCATLILFLAATPATVYAQRAGSNHRHLPVLDRSVRARIDSVFARWDVRDSPGAVLAISAGDSMLYSRGYGMADLEQGVPITDRSVFLVASVSKQFTAFAVALLAERGLLDVDADIRTWIPELRDYGKPITVRHLVHHISGLRDSFDLLGMAGWRMDDVITADHIRNLAFAQEALNFEPGAEYSYSNTGYALLALIVERVSGQPFSQFVSREIFEPIGMSDSWFMDDYQRIVPGRAQGYAPAPDSGWVRQVYSYSSVGETGLFTSARDILRWAAHFEAPKAGGPAAMEMVHTRGILNSGDTLAYAFGQSIAPYRGHRRVSHSGWHRGFRTYLARFPDDGFSVVVLANAVSISAPDLAAEVMDILLEPGEDSLAVYVGTYRSEAMESEFEIVSINGELQLRHVRFDPFHLTWQGPDLFSSDAEFFEDLAFQRAEGRITGFLGSTGRTRKVPFRRID